ncbi:MAG TPA: maleylpyruvate isomerase family mycothiol-dependent enzyme, partial [Acidimicrobiales bacterium]|nr:maleylpyruvate isomerase family mycothiol-dependent enzyme [Acidimicrobiales bacterium]
MELAGIYAETRVRIGALARELTPEQAATPVPATPAWTVQDVLAHLTGVCVDITEGRIEGAATPPWTAAQVEARRGRSLAEVVAEWDERGPALEAIITNAGGAVSAVVADVVTHEQDIRAALGRPGAR